MISVVRLGLSGTLRIDDLRAFRQQRGVDFKPSQLTIVKSVPMGNPVQHRNLVRRGSIQDAARHAGRQAALLAPA